MKKTIILIPFFLSFILIFSCSESNSEPELETFLCCGVNPFETSNIDNLDQTIGEIKVVEVFTPNNDGINDFFEIQNIELYVNNTVTIYDLDDNVVFETQNYNNGTGNIFAGINQMNGTELNFGSYKYKIVIENESTFLVFGYLCFIRNPEEADGMSFNACLGYPDPIIS